MKYAFAMSLFIFVAMFAVTIVGGGFGIDSAKAEENSDKIKVKVDSGGSDQDTSILIHKGPTAGSVLHPSTEYRIVDETEEIAGEPMMDRTTSYKSWKKACDDWKKALKADNGKLLISTNCGRPRVDRDSVTFQTTQTSTGTYKVKVALSEPAGN
jgi:hypothetical protein